VIFSDKIKGAYFIHSAGYVNLSTDVVHRDKIFDQNTTVTKKFLIYSILYKKIFISVLLLFRRKKRAY
jgi:hypothetical protein